jgi:hypothetical protein
MRVLVVLHAAAGSAGQANEAQLLLRDAFAGHGVAAMPATTSQSRRLYLLNLDFRIVKPPTRMTWIGSVPAHKFRASMFSRTSYII